MKRVLNILIGITICSCTEKPDNLCIDNLIRDYPDYKVYVIIPSSVCKSCNGIYNSDMMKAYQSNNMSIVFNCNIQDTVAVKYYFSELSQKHLVIDTLKQYTICDSIPESIYPAIIYMKDDKINKIEYYNSRNLSAYAKLKSFLR
jgi:hypothetical protein